MKLRALTRAVAVTALVALTVGVAPLSVSPVSAVDDATFCDLNPDAAECLPVEQIVSIIDCAVTPSDPSCIFDLTASVTVSNFGGSWSVPVTITGPGAPTTLDVAGTGEVTQSESANILTDGDQYSVSVDLNGTGLDLDSALSCSATGAVVDGAYTFTYTAGTDVECDVLLSARTGTIDVSVTSFGGVGLFGVGAFEVEGAAPGDETTIETLTSGDPRNDSLGVVAGYTYQLEHEASGPWLVETTCEDDEGSALDPAALVLDPDEIISCSIVLTLGVWFHAVKYYDEVASPPSSTTMIATWSDAPFEILDVSGYSTIIPAGTHEIVELGEGYSLTAVCEVTRGKESVQTFIDDGNGSTTFTALRGTAVWCEFTNVPMATVIIEKRIDAPFTGDFQFTATNGSSAGVSPLEIGDPAEPQVGTLLVPAGDQTISESGQAGWNIDSVECLDGEDTPIDVSITGDEFTLEGLLPGGTYYCVVVNAAGLTIEKTGTGMEPLALPGEYRASWDITVYNPSAEEFSDVSLLDEFYFAPGTTVREVTVSSDEGVPINATFDGVSDLALVEPFTVSGPDSTYTFHVEAIIDIEPDLDADARTCPAFFSGEAQGFTNWTSITSLDDGTLGEDWSCVDIPAPEISVTKTTDGEPTQNEDGTISQAYLVTVTNAGDGYGAYDLYDTPSFSSDMDVLGLSVVDPVTLSTLEFDDFSDPIPLAMGRGLGAQQSHEYSVTVVFEVTYFFEDEIDQETWDCALDDDDQFVAGRGLYNEAAVYLTELEPLVAVACIDAPTANIAIDKTVVGHENLAADTIAVDFDIVATNAVREGGVTLPGIYFFIDFPGMTDGLTVTDFEIVGVDGVNEDDGEIIDGFVADSGPFTMLGIGALLPGGAHTWHVRVTYEVDLEGFAGACPVASGPDGEYLIEDLFEFGGLVNAVIWFDLTSVDDLSGLPFFGAGRSANGPRTEHVVTGGFGEVENIFGEGVGISFDCLDVSSIYVDKTVVNDDGGDSEADDFEFSLSDPADSESVERTMSAGEPYAVVSGNYLLAETETPGYTPSNFECKSFDPSGEPDPSRSAAPEIVVEEPVDEPGSLELALEPGFGYNCVITNDDDLVLEVEIDDGGASVVAGGDPVTFEISAGAAYGVVESGDDATITVELADGWSWVPGTVVGCASAVIAGAQLTCQVTPAELNGAGKEFSAQARYAADGLSGDQTALAVIGNDADPAPDGYECGDDNTDCEITPATREASLTATKVSDAVGGTVARGAPLKYTLAVTNEGPSTILPGTKVTDDLPAGLTFVSVVGTGWLCNSGDPVVCTNDTVIEPGNSLPPLVINTVVAANASGTITNTAVFVGIVDREDAAERFGARRTQAVVITATATTSAVATVTVRSGPRTIPGTGSSTVLPTIWLSLLALAAGAGALVLSRRRHRLVR